MEEVIRAGVMVVRRWRGGDVGGDGEGEVVEEEEKLEVEEE